MKVLRWCHPGYLCSRCSWCLILLSAFGWGFFLDHKWNSWLGIPSVYSKRALWEFHRRRAFVWRTCVEGGCWWRRQDCLWNSHNDCRWSGHIVFQTWLQPMSSSWIASDDQPETLALQYSSLLLYLAWKLELSIWFLHWWFSSWSSREYESWLAHDGNHFSTLKGGSIQISNSNLSYATNLSEIVYFELYQYFRLFWLLDQ